MRMKPTIRKISNGRLAKTASLLVLIALVAICLASAATAEPLAPNSAPGFLNSAETSSPAPAAHQSGVSAQAAPVAPPPRQSIPAIENEPVFGPAADHAYHPLSKILPLLLALGLVCIAALIVLPVIYAKKGAGSRPGLTGGLMRILDRQNLAPQKTVYLVEVAGRYLLLGVTDRQINTLTELEKTELEGRLNETAPAGPMPIIPGPLGAWLGRRWQTTRK